MTKNKDRWLEVSAVSRRLSISESTAYRLIKLGILKGRRVGVRGCLRVSELSICTFEEQRAYAEEFLNVGGERA